MYDDANPDKVAQTNVTITVRRNENAPRFENSDTSVNVLEIAPVGTSIATVRAQDADRVSGAVQNAATIVDGLFCLLDNIT